MSVVSPLEQGFVFIITDKTKTRGRKVGGAGVVKDNEQNRYWILSHYVEWGKVVYKGVGSGEGVYESRYKGSKKIIGFYVLWGPS